MWECIINQQQHIAAELSSYAALLLEQAGELIIIQDKNIALEKKLKCSNNMSLTPSSNIVEVPAIILIFLAAH
jgi:hypothetical protein